MSGNLGSKTDIVANEMGKMLLQGYRMLDRACHLCNNVLLQDKQGNSYCIACEKFKNLDAGAGDESQEMVEVDSKLPVITTSTKKSETSEIAITKPLHRAIEVLVQEVVNTANELQLSGLLPFSQRNEYLEYMANCAKTISALQSVTRFESN